MNITISGTNVQVTAAMRAYVLGKLDRIPCKFPQPPTVDVSFGCEKRKKRDRVRCVTISFQTKGDPVVVSDEGEDMYGAVNKAVAKLERQLVRLKDQIKAHHHKPSGRLTDQHGHPLA